MSRFGKCQNLAGCLLAYRGEEIEVEKGQPFICAECGKPLSGANPPSTMWLRYIYGLAGAAVLGGIALFAFPQLRGLIQTHKHEKGESSGSGAGDGNHQQGSNTGTSGAGTTSTTGGSENAGTTPVEPGPSKPIFAPPKIDIDASKGENKEVKNEVLTRIDLMPITQGNKDKLYQSVERARGMGKVLTIPFGSGRTDLSGADIQAMRVELDKTEVARFRSDPTAVFVILGYADTKGDPKKSLVISQSRADAVQRAMKDKCGVSNVLHSVAMGSSKLLDAQKLEKNRIVEVWVVLP